MTVNAKSVIDIEVNDKMFKQFAQSFQQFQTALMNTPKAWKAMNAATQAQLVQLNQMTSALTTHNTLMRKNAAHAKDVSGHLARAYHWVVGMKDHTHKFAENMVKVTNTIAKWASIITGGFTGMGILGLEAIGGFVRRGSNNAAAKGMSFGEGQGMELLYGKTGVYNTGALAGGIAAAREFPGEEQAFLGMLGVNPHTQGTLKTSIMMREALQTMMAKENSNPKMMAKTYGRFMGMFGITEDTLRFDQSMSAKERKELGEKAMTHAEQTALSPDKQKKWNDFMDAIEATIGRMKVIFADKLSDLLPSFERNMKTFMEWITKFVESPEFKGFMDALPEYTSKFIEQLKALWQMIKDITDWYFGKPNLPDSLERSLTGKDTIADAKYAFGPGGEYMGSDTPGVGIDNGGAFWNWTKPGRDAAGEILDSASALFKTRQRPGRLPGRQTGTTGVTETGAFMLHRGESVLPANITEMMNATAGTSMGDWKRAISGIESAGSGGYGAENPRSHATGKYQVMPANIGPWTEAAYGRRLSQAQFKANPSAQEAVFEKIFGGYVNKYGNPLDAAAMWFTGHPLAGNRSGPDAMGTTLPGYLRKFYAGITGNPFGGSGFTINDNTGGNIAVQMQQMSLVGLIPNTFPI